MSTLILGLAGLAGLSAYLYGPATHSTLTKLGVFRTLNDTAAFPATTLGESIRIIDDTVHCEDIHYYAPGHVLFTACEDVNTTRFEWFPALGSCSGAKEAAQKQGSIHVIDPETHTSTRLTFENFHGPFITHGIDVIPASSSHPSEAVYIFAVNHIPGADSISSSSSSSSSASSNKDKNKCHLASRVDVFHHTLGTTTARYLHSISHPLIHTPNDVYGVSANEIYVTNDRWYEGGFMLAVETVWPGAQWSDVVHARRTVDGEKAGAHGQEGEVEANIAIGKLRLPNGLGHGRTDDEMLVTSALGGVLWLASFPSSAAHEAESSPSSEPTIQINGTVDFASTIDNPSWYQDPYISSSSSSSDGHDDDASGFVLAGIKRAVDLRTSGTDPHGREGVIVWYVKPKAHLPAEKWEKKLLWEDDGGLIRNAATAVLVGIDPAKERSVDGGGGGGKKAWLYVTGFSSQNTVAVKVDL